MDHNSPHNNPHPVFSQQEDSLHQQQPGDSQAGAQRQHVAGQDVPLPPSYESIVHGAHGVPVNSSNGTDMPPATHTEFVHLIVAPSEDDNLPPLESVHPVADPMPHAQNAERNPRRARVDDDEDEDDPRDTNRQRMHSPPSDRGFPLDDHHFHPDMHIHAEQLRQQLPPQATPLNPGPVPRPPTPPFNHRLSFTIDILPFGPMPGVQPLANQPGQPAGGPGAPTFHPAFEARVPFPIDAANGAVPHEHTADGQAAHTLFNLQHRLQEQLREELHAQLTAFSNNVLSSLLVEEQEDPKRAKRLLNGLEQVPEGLVKRMERVAGDEGVVCAVCFDGLLDTESAAFSQEKGHAEEKDSASDAVPMEVEAETSSSVQPSTSSESNESVSEEDKKADEALDRKIIVLPCAHAFHASCLRPWFTRPHRTTCPTCRFDIDPDSLTYVPPARQARQRPTARPAGRSPQQTAGAGGPAQPQVGEPVAVPPINDAAAPHLPAGAVPRPTNDANPNDVPYIIFDISMFVPLTPNQTRHGQHPPTQAQAGPMPQVSMFVPPPSTPASAPDAQHAAPAPQPRVEHIDRLLEHFLFTRPPLPPWQAPPTYPPQQQQPQTHPTPAPAVNPQAQPPPTHAPTLNPPPSGFASTAHGPRVFWQSVPTGLPPRGPGPAPQLPHAGHAHGGLGGMFANLFGFGRHQNNTNAAPPPQPEQQAQPPPPPPAATMPHPQQNHPNQQNNPQLPSFEEFMHLVGLPSYTRPQQPAQGVHAQQPPFSAPTGAPQPQQPRPQPPPHAVHNDPDAPFADSFQDFATNFLQEVFNNFQSGQPPAGHPHTHTHRPPMPPPGPIPFTMPNNPRPQSARPPRTKPQWAPPAPPGLTLRERVEQKERELGLRCSDISCGLGPSDEDPEPVVDPSKVRQVVLHPLKSQAQDGKARVCEHMFHPACLVSAERVAGWSGADQKKEVEGEEEVQVSCPACRAVGCISRDEWDEGACALA